MGGAEAHRSGPWKQTNKTHNTGRHRSKGAVEKENRGRVGIKVVSKKGMKVQRRQDRKNNLVQARNLARQEVQNRKRALGGHGVPPILVALVPLSDSQQDNIERVLERLTGLQDIQITKTESGMTHMVVPRFKQRFTFIVPKFNSLYEILDVTKVCDNVVFLLCPHTGMSGRGELILSSVLAQSLPTDPVMVLGSTDEVPPNKMNEVKKLMIKALDRKFPAEKIYTVDSDSDALNLVRSFGSGKRRPNLMRERRGNLIAETVNYAPGEDPTSGMLEVTGYVRGKDISVNRLVHVPGLGDYQLASIQRLPDPAPLAAKRNEMEDLCELLPDETQEDLVTENTPDGMDGEQTWPTDEELKEAETNVKKRTRKVPKGTSEYQAAWILEDGEDEDEDEEEDEDISEDEDMNDIPPAAQEDEDDEEDEGEDGFEEMEDVTVSEAGNTEDYDAKHVNFSEEVNEMERLKEARLEAMFPDEVDTPMDMHARIRFQKYRGLKSFRTSTWDRKENLPSDYARIFQFENFLRTRKRVLNEEVEGAEVGWFVKISIKNVPAHLKEQIQGRLITLCSLLPHEQRMSVLNIAVKRSPLSNSNYVKSKERLVFHCGWRRFTSCPVFSEHSTGNKHKYERYFRPGANIVMTTYAPISFPPAPVLVFQEQGGEQQLLGTGTLLNVDPDRVIVKRAILSGHPFKVNKRSATVRFMFFNREDIAWFKPIELRTKLGRRGHIKEPLGTHGHMKCIFDGQVSQQDTVLINLYKRVFPKWTYDSFVEDPDRPDTESMES